MAGHFKRAIRVLDRTGFPLFGLMRSTGKAVPLSSRSRTVLIPSIPEGQRRSVRDALHNLFMSRRYLHSFLVEGAMTYDLDGIPFGPVTDGERAWAIQRLGGRLDLPRDEQAQGQGVDGARTGVSSSGH